MSHLIQIYPVCKFSCFHLWYLKSSAHSALNMLNQFSKYLTHEQSSLSLYRPRHLFSSSGSTNIASKARKIVGFAGSGPIFETENSFISQQEAEKSVHKTLYFSRFCNIQTDIITCQNCSHLIIRCFFA